MKRQNLKLLLTVICVLAAGICYSCSRQSSIQTGRDDSGMLYLADWTEESGQIPDVSEELISESPEILTQYAETNEISAASEQKAGSESAVPLKPVCYVHICGAVNNPGVYEVEAGTRIFEAIEQAGGLKMDAAQEHLNLALEVEDGMQIVVPSEGEVAAGQGTRDEQPGVYRADGSLIAAGLPGSDAGNAGGSSEAKVNLNTATKAELMTLRGIGEARAEDIIRYRQESGPFSSIEDIKKVSGIKDAAFQKIKDDITV